MAIVDEQTSSGPLYLLRMLSAVPFFPSKLIFRLCSLATLLNPTNDQLSILLVAGVINNLPMVRKQAATDTIIMITPTFIIVNRLFNGRFGPCRL